MQFESELKKLGLTDKEAAVYLASLELGPSPVQNIARKAKVVRATTYVILEHLMKQGLVTKFEQGKKTMFSAEPPRQLLRLLERQDEEIKQKEKELEEILPDLQMIMKASGEKPTVRYFEGREGLKAIRQETVMYSAPGDTLYNFTPTDHLFAVFPDEDDYYRQRIAKGLRSKTLFTTRSEKLKEELLNTRYNRLAERRFIPADKFSVTSGMTIYKDRIVIGSFASTFVGAVIQSQPMADMMRALFEVAWMGAEKFNKKP